MSDVLGFSSGNAGNKTGSSFWHKARAVLLVPLFLITLVFAAYGQTLLHGFVNYDDGEYVFENPHVFGGFSHSSVRWAFTHSYASNWHPLTWLSHMADCQVYGLHAGGHHASNVILHAAATVLLFLAMRALTGAMWRSGFVAALFAIHPLRVESVAWVAERKDVLSGALFMLTLWTYARYVHSSRGRRWYAATISFFALSLLAKPSVVTLPFVLLLLDYWPLRRLTKSSSFPRLIVEKIPLFALSAASCVTTILAQTKAMMSIAHLPLPSRLANAIWSYVAYLGQMICPARLAVFYPLQIPPWWVVLLASAFLAGVTAAAIGLRERQPWFLVGWLWYLGVLVPMIGLMQVGGQSHADRYTYLSHIGLYFAVVWMIERICSWSARYRRAATGGAVVLLAALLVRTRVQVEFWRDSETLWRHTLACTSRNAIAHNLLAMALAEKGRSAEAFAEFQTALRINANDPGTHFHMGVYLAKKGELEAGIGHLRRGLAIEPHDAGAETDLGLALAGQGQQTEAIAHYRQALKIEPDFAAAQNNLAWALATSPDASLRDGPEAVALAQKCCETTNHKTPEYLDTLAAAYAEAGRFDEALQWAQAALEKTAGAESKEEMAARLEAYGKGQPWREPTPPSKP